MGRQPLKKKSSTWLLHIGLCALFLLAGIFALTGLTLSKQPPAQIELTRAPVPVVVQPVVVENATVLLDGFGEAKPLHTLIVSAEVSGRVIGVHERLHAGEVMSAGEVLFTIDPTDFEATCRQIKEQIGEHEARLSLLRQQYRADKKRIQTLTKSRDLAQNNYRRIRTLLEENQIGTRSAVEGVQRTALAATDAVDVLANTLALYPGRIEAAGRQLAETRIRLEKARRDLARCMVRAPFTGRIKGVQLQVGQVVAQGEPLFQMSDDSILEIQVPLSSSAARKWLCFDDNQTDGHSPGWFWPLRPVACRVTWSEGPASHSWTGKLHRVVAFDARSRTLTVAVRVRSDGAPGEPAGPFPLVEGMFCAVSFPGRTIQKVVRLPRTAIRPSRTVYLANANRLKTAKVSIAHTDRDDVLIDGGLKPGDRVIVSPLADPLENEPLMITGSEGYSDSRTADPGQPE